MLGYGNDKIWPNLVFSRLQAVLSEVSSCVRPVVHPVCPYYTQEVADSHESMVDYHVL